MAEIIPALPKIPTDDGEMKYTLLPTFDSLVLDDENITLDSKLVNFESTINELDQTIITPIRQMVDSIEDFRRNL